MKNEAQCCARVRGHTSFRSYACKNPAVMMWTDGKTYCGIHNPDKVAARKAKSAAAQNDALNARMEQHRKLAAYDGLVEALQELEALFEGQEDCDDGTPNDAMRAMTIIGCALSKAGV